MVVRRYAFTIVGVAIGVAGLVALGAMSERIVRFIREGSSLRARPDLGGRAGAGHRHRVHRGRSAVGGDHSGDCSGPRRVHRASPSHAPLNPSVSQFMTFAQEMIVGLDLAASTPNRAFPILTTRAGRRDRYGGSRWELGASFADSRKLGVGDVLTLDSQSFKIVGVLGRLCSQAPDRFVIVPIEIARRLWVTKDPLLRTVIASGGVPLTATDLNTGAAVGWRDGEDPDAVAIRIRDQIPGVKHARIPSKLTRLLRENDRILPLLVGIAALGLLIGGLSLANTVTAALFERIRDFGVKRALGAPDRQLGREILGETLLVTLTGGVGGIGLAVALGAGVEAYAADGGQSLFFFSLRLLRGRPGVLPPVGWGGGGLRGLGVRSGRVSPAIEAIRRGT